MIGYFLRTSKGEAEEIFSKYVWALSKIIKNQTLGKIYSGDIETLLIEYFYQGEYIAFPKKEIRFISYRKSEKMAIISVGIHKEFINLNDFEKKEIIINTTISAIELGRDALGKKKLDVSKFLQLEQDIHTCFEEYQKLNINI